LLHDDGQVSHSFCLLCSFAKAQVNAAEAGLISVRGILSLLGPVIQTQNQVFALFDYRLSPCRAPPGRQ
jgi:hypothetical protein